MRSRNLQDAFCTCMKARRGGRRRCIGWRDAGMSIASLSRRQAAAAALGLCPRRDRARPTPITKRWGKPRCWCRRASAAYVPARHPALRYGHRAQRRRLFLGSAGGAGSGVGGGTRRAAASASCCGPASRSPTPICACGCGKPHAAARLLGEALGELDTLGDRKAIAGGDGFVDGFPTAALAALLQARLAQPALSKADWVEIGAIGRT